jgi:hypothetical protein
LFKSKNLEFSIVSLQMFKILLCSIWLFLWSAEAVRLPDHKPRQQHPRPPVKPQPKNESNNEPFEVNFTWGDSKLVFIVFWS